MRANPSYMDVYRWPLQVAATTFFWLEETLAVAMFNICGRHLKWELLKTISANAGHRLLRRYDEPNGCDRL